MTDIARHIDLLERREIEPDQIIERLSDAALNVLCAAYRIMKTEPERLRALGITF
jgi:hypothetical protein